MYGQEPLQGEFFYIGTPVPEWNVNNKNDQPGQKELFHKANIITKFRIMINQRRSLNMLVLSWHFR